MSMIYNLIFLLFPIFFGYVSGVDIKLPIQERSRRDTSSVVNSGVCQSVLNENAKEKIEKNMV